MTNMLTDVSDGIASITSSSITSSPITTSPITTSPITTAVIGSGAGEKAFVAEPEFRWT